MKKYIFFILLLMSTHHIAGMSSDTQKKCQMCWDTDSKVISLPCHTDHTFHIQCLTDWISCNPTQKKCFFCLTPFPQEIENSFTLKQKLRYWKNSCLEKIKNMRNTHIHVTVILDKNLYLALIAMYWLHNIATRHSRHIM